MNKLVLTSISAAMALSVNASEWDNNFNLGATYTSGNSDSLLVTAGITSEMKTQSDEYLLNLFYTYGETSSNATNDETYGNASWKHLVDERNYYGARADFLRDDIADLDYRASATALAGRYFIKNDITTLALEAGLGYSFEKQSGLSDNYAHLYVGEFFTYQFTEATKFFQSIAAFVPVDSTSDITFVAEAGVETSLSDTLSLRVYIQNKYDAAPTAGVDKNDFKLVTGISYKF